MIKRLRRKKKKKQDPSMLANLLIGDIKITGGFQIELPRATNSVIVVTVNTYPKEDIQE